MKCPQCRTELAADATVCPACGARGPAGDSGTASSAPTREAAAAQTDTGVLFAGKYRIQGEIGRGGMGVVFKAQDARLARPVALKVLSTELSASPQARERFIREGRAAAGLDHPNICTVYDAGEAEGQAYLSMALIEGQNLKQRIASGRLPVGETLELARQIAAGLAAAHEKGVVHRDIKPANIMLTPRGQAKIMDFGVARLQWADDLTRESAVIGTAAYMAPEQALGAQCDHRADIWALGCVLYEMLVGEPPFATGPDLPPLPGGTVGARPSIRGVRPDVPDRVVAIIDGCLRFDPRDRYPGAAELLVDLERALRDFASPAPARTELPSLAVLPFVDMSPGKDHEYLSEGIAEELIHGLTCLQGLRVVARTSAFALKDRNLDAREIGRLLKVGALLEGSVRKAGDRLRVTAQLIDARDGSHIWSERFDRQDVDIFAIQDEISLAIVEHLRVTLLVREKSALQRRSTGDADAYSLYLKGLYFVARLSPEAAAKALSFFQEALERDPDFAQAYAGIASVYATLGIANLAPPAEMRRRARSALERALQLDPSLPEALAVAAAVAFWFDWDWAAAERLYRQVLALSPGDAGFRGWYAWFLVNRGRPDESTREIKRALALDPLAPIFYAFSIGLHTAADRPDEALEDFTRSQEIEPNFAMSYFHAGVAYAQTGRFDEALRTFEKGKQFVDFPGWGDGMIAICHRAKGETEQADRAEARMLAGRKTAQVSATALAWVAGSRGDLDGAFRWLDTAFEERDTLMVFLHIYTGWLCPQLVRDSRFARVLARMNLLDVAGLPA
jgi:TolB-like protein/Tfp pilus assembly protein PilF